MSLFGSEIQTTSRSTNPVINASTPVNDIEQSGTASTVITNLGDVVESEGRRVKATRIEIIDDLETNN